MTTMNDKPIMAPHPMVRDEYHTVSVKIPSSERIFFVKFKHQDIQLRLEENGKLYFCASDDFMWQDKIVSGELPWEVFYPEWRKFCEAMRARAKELKP